MVYLHAKQWGKKRTSYPDSLEGTWKSHFDDSNFFWEYCMKLAIHTHVMGIRFQRLLQLGIWACWMEEFALQPWGWPEGPEGWTGFVAGLIFVVHPLQTQIYLHITTLLVTKAASTVWFFSPFQTWQCIPHPGPPSPTPRCSVCMIMMRYHFLFTS